MTEAEVSIAALQAAQAANKTKKKMNLKMFGSSVGDEEDFKG